MMLELRVKVKLGPASELTWYLMCTCFIFTMKGTMYSTDFYLLEYNDVESSESQPTFQRNVSSPVSDYCLANSSTLKMEAIQIHT
jgi:hypothetical protein